MVERRQGIPYVSEVQATARSGFAVRAPPPAPAPILIQQQRSFTDFLFQIDDTDDVDSDVLVEMDLGLSPDQTEEVATVEELRSSISMLSILNLNLGILLTCFGILISRSYLCVLGS